MPFAENPFPLLINRHEAYNAFEIDRLLKTGGRFLTQQVDGQSMADLAFVCGREPTHPQATLAISGKEVEQAGLIIELAEESVGNMRFTD